ncbi:MAG: site-specific integrase [Planctomycetales bacterium]|nr:site-specific integrase [Planctomycetales bacterium]
MPAEFDKCGVERVKPLHRVAIAHLLKIRLPNSSRLFEWRHGWKAFYKEWHAIQDMAGIETKDHFTLHDLKRTAGTELSEIASPWVVQQMLDHSSINTSRHYVNAAEQCREAVDNFPMPDCFLVNTEGG